METKTLKSFIAVAELKNFSAAARALHTVQPAISRHIADLEEELGVSLFWRNTREVRITGAGQVLLKQAKEILGKNEQAKELVQRAASGDIGELRIGYLASPCVGFLPGMIRLFSSRYPGVKIQIKELTAQQQIDAFEADNLDIGFSRPLPSTKQNNYAVDLIYVDSLFVVLASSHPLNKGRPISLAQIATEPFILFKREEAVGLFDQVITSCKQQGFSPNIISQPDNMQTILTEVAAGLGVSIVPGCVKNLISSGCLFTPIKNLQVSIPLELHRKAEHSSETARNFATLVADENKFIRNLIAREST